jgi:hypothetical protein
MGEQTIPFSSVVSVATPPPASLASKHAFARRAAAFVICNPPIAASPSRVCNDPIPRYAVRWTDLNGVTCSSPDYYAHEDADEHFKDLIADRATFQARLVEQTDDGDRLVRTWKASLVPPTVC